MSNTRETKGKNNESKTNRSKKNGHPLLRHSERLLQSGERGKPSAKEADGRGRDARHEGGAAGRHPDLLRQGQSPSRRGDVSSAPHGHQNRPQALARRRAGKREVRRRARRHRIGRDPRARSSARRLLHSQIPLERLPDRKSTRLNSSHGY